MGVVARLERDIVPVPHLWCAHLPHVDFLKESCSTVWAGKYSPPIFYQCPPSGALACHHADTLRERRTIFPQLGTRFERASKRRNEALQSLDTQMAFKKVTTLIGMFCARVTSK